MSTIAAKLYGNHKRLLVPADPKCEVYRKLITVFMLSPMITDSDMEEVEVFISALERSHRRKCERCRSYAEHRDVPDVDPEVLAYM